MDYVMIGPYQFDRDASKDDMRLDYCSSFQEVALDESSLSFDTVSIEVCTTTIGTQLSALPNNTPIVVYRDGEIKARFVSSGVSRIGPVTYQLTGRSPMGALTGMVHTGGIYTGQTVEAVVKEICGNIPSMIKSVYAGVKLYGWLPYADGKERSARDNLAQVLFAIGAYLRTDLNGVLRIEPLWDGTASLIDVDRSYTGGTVKYDVPISAVTVTEHQYVAGTETKELFSGTAQNGDIITFSEPMHSLSATGFTILESGANYAKISAGSGALTGKAYIHNTRLITQPVTANTVENIKSVTDATLVSLVNSYAVAKRLADYYRCRETITNDIVSGHEKPGHVVSVYHPYDKKMVSACIQSLDTTMSATLKSSMEALVGFTPAQPESAEYFDERVILTGSGEWAAPEGVTSYTRVLVGGGHCGGYGYGGNPATLKTESYTETIIGSLIQHNTDKWALGGKGGKGGEGGEGGKVLVETITDAVPGAKVPYACGVGGVNAAGTATTMGGSSSDTGSSSTAGYTDPVTGEVFAAKGEQGIAGGDGAGMNPDHGDNDRYIPLKSTSVVDEDGHVWEGGATKVNDNGAVLAKAGDQESFTSSLSDGYVGGAVTYNCGSGAAAGANGNPGNAAGSFQLVADPPSGVPKTSITVTVRGSASVAGADATLVPKKPTIYGKGGRGGYGGGGDGATGLSRTFYGGSKSGTRNNYPGSVRTTGSNGAQGGPGGDGCIILYYRRPKPLSAGWLSENTKKPMLDRLGRRLIV